MRKGWVAAKVDLKDAYFHMQLAPTLSQFVRVQVGDVEWEVLGACFGLNTLPQSFMLLMKVLEKIWRAQGILSLSTRTTFWCSLPRRNVWPETSQLWWTSFWKQVSKSIEKVVPLSMQTSTTCGHAFGFRTGGVGSSSIQVEDHSEGVGKIGHSSDPHLQKKWSVFWDKCARDVKTRRDITMRH